MSLKKDNFCLVLAFCALVVACDDDDLLAPDLDSSSDVSFDSASDSSDARADADQPNLNTVVLETGSLTLRVTTEPFSFELTNSLGEVVLATLVEDLGSDLAMNAYHAAGATVASNGVTANENPGWNEYDQSNERWESFDSTLSSLSEGGVLTLVLSSTNVVGLEVTMQFTLVENRLEVDAVLSGDAQLGAYNRIGQSFQLGPDEHFLGLGERFTSVDHRGLSVQNWTQTDGIGLGEDTAPNETNPAPSGESMTPFPIPFVLDTIGFGLWLETDGWAAMHLGSETEAAWRIEAEGYELHYTVFVNQDPLKTVSNYATATGLPALPPLWTFGPRRRLDPGSTVFDFPEWTALREFGIPTTTVEHDIEFLPVGEERNRVDELAPWAADLDAAGFRVFGQLSPFIAVDGIAVEEDYDRAMHGGWLLQDTAAEAMELQLPGYESSVAMVDVTHPDAGTYYGELLSSLSTLGYDGVRLIHGEQVPITAIAEDGRTGSALHNAYSALFHALLADQLALLGEDSPHLALIGRAGYVGSAQHLDAIWSGNATTSFGEADGLPSVVRAGINLGVSGVPYYGANIGGYDSVDSLDRDLYLRWAAFAAYSPQMHDEVQSSADEAPRWTIWEDEETLSAYRDLALMHTRLGFYLHAAARDANLYGWPVMRHLFLHHPGDPLTVAIDDQYYLGEALLVAPIVQRGVTSRSVYFPEGRFVDWTSGAVYEGPGRFTVDAAIGSIPVFMSEGAIVPLLDASIDTLSEESNPGVVGPSDVSDVLDVRAVLGEVAESVELVDGTILSIAPAEALINGAPNDEYDFVAGETPLVAVDTREEMAECTACFFVVDSSPSVLLLNPPKAESIDVMGGGIVLGAANPMGLARQIRWHVTVLDPPSDDLREE